MNKIIYYIVLIMVFSACQIGKEYVRPSVAMPNTFRGASDTLNKNTDTIVLPWKSFFVDAALQNIIESVLQHNYDMAIAIKTIRLNDEYLKEAKLSRLPLFSANIGASSNFFSDNSLNGANGFNLGNSIATNNRIEDYTISTGMSWEIDIWGKLKKQKTAAFNNWLQSIEAKKVLQTSLIASTSSSYYTLIMLKEQLAIAHKNLILSANTVKLIQIQFENGEATSLALQQAKVQYKSVEAIIPDLEQEQFIQENVLNILMGQQLRKIELPEIKIDFRIPAKFYSGVPALLMSNRPDVRQKEFELRAATARIGIAQANLYPALNITASGGLNSFQSSNWLAIPGSLFGNLAGNLTQPIFNRRKLKTALNVSKITYEKKVDEFRKAILVATGEVSNALFKIDKLNDKIAITTSKDELLQKAISDASLLFRNGKANYLEVITVEQNLIANELNLATLKKEQARACIELYRALGGGQ